MHADISGESITEVTAPDEKFEICLKILQALPDWFGVEKMVTNYANDVRDNFFCCAFDNNNLAGFVSLKVHNPHTAEIHVMGILQEYHRRGIGRMLIERCIQQCRLWGMDFLTVKTLADIHPDEFYKKTRQFYQAMGFKPLEVFPLHWDADNPCLLMAMPVNYVSE